MAIVQRIRGRSTGKLISTEGRLHNAAMTLDGVSCGPYSCR